MSVNFTQNPDYRQQQDNFGASVTDAPPQYGILKGMGLPSNVKEAKEWAPYFVTSLGLSKLISDSAVFASRVNPKNNPAMTVAESFDKSLLGKVSAKVDNFVLPHLNKHASKINSVKAALTKYTPDWVKNIFEKFAIGVNPRNVMALGQYRGATLMASNELIGKLRNIPASEWAKLGVKDVSDILKPLAANSSKKSVLRAMEQVSERLAKVPAQKLQEVLLSNGKPAKLLNDLNKIKAFIGLGSKTTLSKYIKKGSMYTSEALGGGVLGGGNLFGLAMNSIFLASTIKRTWNAPWGDKLSTFMEGALVEFGGIYLTMLAGTRLTYKLLGLKNIDKTSTQIRSIKGLTQGVNTLKTRYDEAGKILKIIEKGPSAEGILSRIVRKFKGQTFDEALASRINGVLGGISKYKNLPVESMPAALMEIRKQYPSLVNKSIDRLAKMRKFQANGNGFFRKLFNRPIRWVGNFFSVGLENLPTKIATEGTSKLGVLWHSFVNKFKSCAGYPLRFILVAMIITPPLTNLLGKISHTLFGKPKNSVMDEGKEPKPDDVQKPQDQNMDKMQAFSEITKQLGKMREAAQPTKYPPNYNPQMSDSLVARAINDQRNRMEQKNNSPLNISPATYIPNQFVSPMTDPDVIAELNYKLDKCNRLEQYAANEISSLNAHKDPYKS